MFLRILGVVIIAFTLGAFVAPPFSGLDTLPALGVVTIALSIILEDVVVLAIGVFIGLIVIPALIQRSRYVVIAAIAIFFALGRYNPLLEAAVQALPQIRFARFPEKFAIPL